MKLKHISRNALGLTLIEVIVSIALLAIVAMILVTIMSESLTFITATHNRNTGGMSAASSMESAEAATPGAATSSFTITVNGSTSTYSAVSGNYVTDSTSSVTYNEFVPS